MQIREMIKNDIEQLAELYFQFWGDKCDVRNMAENFDVIQKENHHILLCAVDNNKLIGSVMGIVCRELYGNCSPFLILENMIVDKNNRRKGTGKAMLHELEKRAKARNCSQIILVTEKDRHDACGFYENNGFQLNNKGYKKIIYP